MHSIIKKIHYLSLVILFSFVSTHISAVELTQEEVDGIDFQLHGIALFGGTDVFSSSIKVLTKSPFSHIGIIVHDASGNIDDETSWYCFESTGSAGEVLKRNPPHVRVTPWADVCQDYGGSITTRLLTFEEGSEPDGKVLTDYIRATNGRIYETKIFELVKSLMNWNKQAGPDALFCSELAAETFMQLGYMERGEDGDGLANNWLPAEFSVAQGSGLSLQGATLGDELYIKTYRLGRFVRLSLWLRKHLSCRGGGAATA